MSDLDPIELEIIMNSTEVAAQSERVRGALRGVDSAAENTRRQFNAITQEQLKGRAATDDLASAFNRLTPAVAAYFSYNTAKSFVSELINVRGEFQKTEIALKTMLGSEEKANGLMKDAIDLAAKTPFEMKDVSNGIKQLLAFQVPAEEVIDTLTRMGNVASGLGVPIDRLQLVFGQVRAKGKLMGDDLRQFTEAGVPMVAELAKKFGESESAIYNMVSAGKIGFNDVKDVLWQMTNEGGMFFNLMEEQSKSVAGQVSNLEDAVTQMFNEMGKSSQNFLSSGIGGVAYLVENYKTVLDVLGGVIAMYGSYKAAIMLVSAVEAARAKTLATEIASLGIAEKMQLGRALVTERQAKAALDATRAELAQAQAVYASSQAEVAALNIKKEKLVLLATEKQQLFGNAQLQLSLAQMELQSITQTGTARQIKSAQKAVEIQQNNVAAAQESAAIARTGALTAARAANTAQTNVGNAAKAVSIARTNAEAAADALATASKNASAIAESKLTFSMQLRAAATQLVTRAQALLNATMLSNPIVAVIGAVGGLIYAYVKLRDNTTALDKAEKELQETREKSKKQIDDIKSKTQELINITRSETASKLEQAEAYKQLQSMYPATLKSMDIETFKKQDAVKVQQKLNEVTDRYSLKSLRDEIQKSTSIIDKMKQENEELMKSLGRGREGSDAALTATLERNLKLIEKEQIKLRENNNTLREKEELQKQANMTLEQRQKYWQAEVDKIQRSIEAQKRSNSEKTTGNSRLMQMNALTGTVGSSLQALSISPLLAQLNRAKQELGNLTKAAGGKDVSKDKAYWEAQKKKAEEAIDGMAGGRNNPQAREHLKLIQEADTALKAYDYSNRETIKTENKAAAAAKKAAGERERAATQLRNKQKEALRDITEAERSLEKERLGREMREIANIEDKYKKLREQAKEAKLSAAEIARIDGMQKIEIEDQKYRQQTAEYLKHLEEEKELFAAYEALKEKVGTDAARERYGAQLKEFQTYGEKLQGEITALQNAGATEGPQLERLQELKEMLAEFNRNQLQAEQQRYAEAYEVAMTHQEKLAQIERDYQAQRLELEKITDEQLRAAKIAELDLQRNAAIDSANAEAFAKTEIFQRLSENLIGITRRDLKLRIQALKEYLATAKGLTDEQKTKIQKELNRTEKVLGATEVQTKINLLLQRRQTILEAMQGYGQKSNEDSEKLKNEWIEINRLIKEAATENLRQFAQYAQDASGIFGQMAGAVGDSNEGLSDTLSTIGEIAGIAGNAASAFASFATGDIVGGIKSAISAISGIFSIGKKSRESERKANEEMRKYYEELAEKERAYQSMLRDRERQIIRNNKLTLDGIRDTFKLLGQQQGQIQSQYERLLKQIQGSGQQVTGQHTEKYGGFLGIGRKTRVVQDLAGVGGMGFEQLEALYEQGKLTEGTAKLFEQLRKLKEEGANVAQTLEDLAREANELWTGTTADSITDSIVQGFKNGYRTAEDFADNFEDMMKGAMLNSFKYQVVEKQIEAFYKNFAAASADGGLNEERIAELRAQYAAMIAAMGQEFDDLAAITGIGFDEVSPNSLQGAYKAASQESIDLLAGQTGGMRLAQLETNQILKNGYAQMLEQSSHSIRLQIQIEENTRRTANNTEVLPMLHDTLKRVESALKENKNALNSVGIR